MRGAKPRRGSLLKVPAFAVVSFVAIQALAQIPLATNEYSFAFWPMTDEPNGALFTDPNHAESATTHTPNLSSVAIRADVAYQNRKIRCRTYGDGCVVITNDVPGKYLFANATDKMPMCDAYHSFRCVNFTSTHAGKANPSAWINNLCVEMRDRPAWTLEYFVKNCGAKGTLSYFDISGNTDTYRLKLDFPSAGNVNRVKIFAGATGKTESENKSQYDFPAGTDLSTDGKWHHVALAYCQTQAQIDKGEDGDLQLYVDYQLASSTIKVRRDKSATYGEARFRNSVGDGFIAAPRFTTKCLTADELMRASDEMTQGGPEPIAYYPFDEQPQGVLLETSDSTKYTSNDKLYTNQVVSSYNVNGRMVALMAKAQEGRGGVAFVSTNVVPARYIYPNLAATIPLREPKRSLYVTDATNGVSTTDSGLQSTIVNINGMSRTLNCQLSDWTMEWFFRFVKEPGRTMMYCYLIKDDSNSKTNSQFNVTRPMDKGANVMRVSTIRPGGYQGVTYSDLTTLADGRWHHFAIVCRDDKLYLYCDYILRTAEGVPVARDASLAGVDETRFVQGCQRGMLSNLRVTGAALEPREFLYASDNATGVLGTSGYLWTLDGQKGGTVASVPATKSTLPTDADQYLFADAKGLVGSLEGSGTASYAAAVFAGHRILDGTDEGRNRSSAALSAAYAKGGQSAPLCQLGRTFTVEACVNATAPSSGSATVFGAETEAGASAWRMLLGSDGALKLAVALSTGDVVEKTVVASGFAGVPRQLAVTADLTARLVKVYVDRSLALTVDETAFYMPLVDGPTLVAGGGCGGATLDGRIDEVRVSREILDNDDFERFETRGIVLIFK